jgi:hypothetical protein
MSQYDGFPPQGLSEARRGRKFFFEFFCSREIMLYRKPKEGTESVAMGPRVLTASSGLAPWSMAVDRTPSAWRKIQPLMGVKGACPLGLPPPLGERGGHPHNFHASSKTRRDLYRANFSVTYPPRGAPRRGRRHSSCLMESVATIFSEMDLIYQAKKMGYFTPQSESVVISTVKTIYKKMLSYYRGFFPITVLLSG